VSLFDGDNSRTDPPL